MFILYDTVAAAKHAVEHLQRIQRSAPSRNIFYDVLNIRLLDTWAGQVESLRDATNTPCVVIALEQEAEPGIHVKTWLKLWSQSGLAEMKTLAVTWLRYTPIPRKVCLVLRNLAHSNGLNWLGDSDPGCVGTLEDSYAVTLKAVQTESPMLAVA